VTLFGAPVPQAPEENLNYKAVWDARSQAYVTSVLMKTALDLWKVPPHGIMTIPPNCKAVGAMCDDQ